MANSIRLSQKSKVRSRKHKVEQENLAISEGRYIQDFMIQLTFGNGEKKLIDFLPLFHKYVKGENLKYFAPQNFRKFSIENGNIYWGKNEDVIFPAQMFYEEQKAEEEEVLFVL